MLFLTSIYPNWTNKNCLHFYLLPINEKYKMAATDKKNQFSAILSLIMNIRTQNQCFSLYLVH